MMKRKRGKKKKKKKRKVKGRERSRLILECAGERADVYFNDRDWWKSRNIYTKKATFVLKSRTTSTSY